MRYLNYYLLFFLSWHIISCTPSDSSENSSLPYLPSRNISLSEISAFANPPTNWSVVGSVYANRKEDKAIETEPGTGVLVNQPRENAKGNLFTAFEHGDLDLDLEFMMPKSSNSGVYLQGRYEVQLFDSWGKDNVTFSDCGGIYQRWKNNQGFEGATPHANASFAPGLWQHLSIKFEAPRFDSSGKKVRNAMFREVQLNGIVIHENVAVSGPTRAAAFDDEKPTAPLMLQGDHGPVAFRNIRYKRYGNNRIALSEISYEHYEGKFQSFDTLSTLEPQNSGSADSISYQVVQQPQDYALVFSGNLSVPTTGDYLMTLRSAGGSWLWIDDKMVVDNGEGNRVDIPGYSNTYLEEGEHPFKLVFNKPGWGWRQGLAWEYEGPEIPVTALQSPGSMPKQSPPPPHVIEINAQPTLQRGFWWVDEEVKKTHTVAVGLPSAVNYVYDLSSAALLAGWGGNFVDATQMWHSRGEDQSLTALGGVVPFAASPSFAYLASSQAVWPDSVDLESESFRYAGYQLAPDGTPIFEYELPHGTLRDQIDQRVEERSLHRTITASIDRPISGWYCLLAEGSKIAYLPDGSYTIDDHRYYLTIDEAEGTPIEREKNGKTQLLLPLIAQNDEVNISYTIIW
ncbi:MAG: family 16 glycoside hydrolase [Bacteroidota bacterium]